MMMNPKLLLPAILFCFSAGAYSQSHKKKKEFSFKITGLTSNFQGSKIYLHHKWDEKDFTDSALVEKGSFVFNLRSPEPNMYWFTLSNSVNAQPNLIFFIDNVNIKVSLKGDSIASSVIEGGQTQKDYVQYRNIANNFVMTQQKLQSDYTLAQQSGKAMAVTKVQQDYQALAGRYYADLKEFIRAHPKSAVAGYIIFKEFINPNLPIDMAVDCLAITDKSIESTKFIRLAAKKINDFKGTQIGAIATDFEQASPEGKSVKLSELRGKYVLVDFWASWCRPCRMENPNVVSAYHAFKDKGFTVLGVSLDSNREQWIAAIQNDHLEWQNVSDLKGGSNDVAILYGIQNIPQNVLIDRDGKIVAKNLRGPALEEKLRELIR